MKKMMIAVCVAALAGMTHAATVNWSLSGSKDFANDAYSFFVVGQKGVESAKQIIDLCSGGKDVSTFAWGSGTLAGTGLANGSSGSLAAGDYEAFFVVFDSAKATDASNFIAITSEQSANLVKTVSATAGSVTFAGGAQTKFMAESSNWSKFGSGSTSDVPEPTSGLLALLGIAALALKRKVA